MASLDCRPFFLIAALLLGTLGAVTPMVPNHAALVDSAQLGSSNPHITLGQTLVSGWAADIISAEQLNAQPTIASDNVLAYSSKGWLMYPPIQGPDYPTNMGTDAYQFSLGPLPAGTWSWMALSQQEDLHSLAQQLGGGDVNAGLFKLGILGSDQTADVLICYEVYDSGVAYPLAVSNATTRSPKPRAESSASSAMSTVKTEAAS